MSRMETGFRPVAARDVRDLCDLYQVDDSQRQYLMKLSREGRRQGWWQSYDVPYATYIGLEADAIAIDMFPAAMMPGLLQNADYARAILKNSGTDQDHEAIEQGVAVRLTRQRLLIQDNPPQFRVIMDEAALRRIVGGPLVMKAQLNQIIEKSSLPNVNVRIIPCDVGAYPALDSSFTILELPMPMPGVVYVEGLFGNVSLERPQDVERYRRIFQDMQLIAATEEKSIALIAEVIRDLNSST